LEHEFDSDNGQIINDYDELAATLCEALSLFNKDNSNINEFHVKNIFQLLSSLIGVKSKQILFCFRRDLC